LRRPRPESRRRGDEGVNEVIFLVEEAAEGGYTARVLGASIYTEADDLAELHEQVREAVRCHFDEGEAPKMIRLHVVREGIIAPLLPAHLRTP
jgi:hypothetical protein